MRLPHCKLRPVLTQFRLLFFQAEDGIRDTSVTGVQTCALPIWIRRNPLLSGRSSACPEACCRSGRSVRDIDTLAIRCLDLAGTCTSPGLVGEVGAIPGCERRSIRERSEERRVGKECRAGWARRK